MLNILDLFNSELQDKASMSFSILDLQTFGSLINHAIYQWLVGYISTSLKQNPQHTLLMEQILKFNMDLEQLKDSLELTMLISVD